MDIVPVDEHNVVRLQFITCSLYKITHVSSQKNSDLVKFMIMKFKFICQLVFEMKNAEIAVEITAFAIFFDWVSVRHGQESPFFACKSCSIFNIQHYLQYKKHFIYISDKKCLI